MLAKHSKNLDLIESVSTAVDRLQRGWKPIREMIDFKRNHQLTDGKARDMLYRLLTSGKLPISLFRTTHKEFFERPSYDEFRPRTLWSLENAVTTSIKNFNRFRSMKTQRSSESSSTNIPPASNPLFYPPSATS